MTRKTPIYNEHEKLGAKIVDFAGWEMPIQYTGITDEHLAVRNNAGLFDVSHMGEFEVTGSDAISFLDYLTPSNNAKLNDGQAQYSLLLTEDGTIVDDIIIYRLNPEKFLIVVNASNIEKDYQWIEKNLKGNVTLKNLSDNYSLIAIQGPKAAAILSSITETNIDSIKTFYFASSRIKGVGEVTIARTGYTGEDGFEIMVPNKEAALLWNVLIEAGKDSGLKPCGLAARDTLRLEMKYTLYSHEINETTNALEAGLRWVVKLKKPADFIGKNALLKIKEEGIKRKLIGFKMVDKGIPRQGYPITLEGQVIGEVTSGTFSPSLKAPIGIGYLKKEFGNIGTKIYIDIRGKERLAEVVETPFYKRVTSQ